MQVVARVAGHAGLGQALVDHAFVERGGFHAGRRIEGGLVAGIEHVAAHAPQRIVEISVGIQVLALDAIAVGPRGLDLFRGGNHVVPGLGAIGEACLAQHVLVIEHGAHAGRNRQRIRLAIDIAGFQEGRNELVLERRIGVIVDRLHQAVVHEIAHPAGRDVGQVGRVVAGDFRLQFLLHVLPASHLDLDLVSRVGLFVVPGQRLQPGARVVAVAGHGDADISRLGREGGKTQKNCAGQ
ncbi:hypothetical protein D3C72_1053830 [compost metagenome]